MTFDLELCLNKARLLKTLLTNHNNDLKQILKEDEQSIKFLLTNLCCIKSTKDKLQTLRRNHTAEKVYQRTRSKTPNKNDNEALKRSRNWEKLKRVTSNMTDRVRALNGYKGVFKMKKTLPSITGYIDKSPEP